MKIFSWVHRHFHQKDAKKDGNDKIALLENKAFASACDGWKDGILAIGTMGHDLCQDFNTKDATFTNDQVSFFGDEDDGDHEEEDEMECPLLALKPSKHGFDDHVDQKQDRSPCDEVAKPNINHQEDIGMTKDATKIKKSGERTTLADLLWADSENNLLKNNKLSNDHKLKVPCYSNKNVDTESIKSSLTSKKIKKIDKEDSAKAIKKTKRLITKMLRKKIHPDVGIQKKETANQEVDVHDNS